ncbi:MAG: hypothetical protein ABH860_00275 [bacterium]
MNHKISKKQIMEHYYSDEELKDIRRMSTKATLKWLEEGRRFFDKAVPKRTKKLQEKLALEGW